MALKSIKIGLLGRIIIAIILGIIGGSFFPEILIRFFVTINKLFSEFLTFSIPLIIVGLVTPAISDYGKGARKLLVTTVIIAYVATLCSGYLAYFTGRAIFPTLGVLTPSAEGLTPSAGFEPYFTIKIPAPLDVMTSLALAFLLGLGIAYHHSPTLKAAADEFRQIILGTISAVIIPFLPVYIFGIFVNMSATGEVYHILTVFAKIIGVIFILHILLILLLYSIAGVFVKRSPLKLIRQMLPAYFTALGTQSSAATIPVTLDHTIKNGVSKEIAGFVIPLCATIHLSGSMLKIVCCALAIVMMHGESYSFSLFTGFIFLLGITMVAAPGVPGGAIMAALGVLGSVLHFNQDSQAMMIALYIAMDSFGTACNVIGDGALALIIDKYFRRSE